MVVANYVQYKLKIEITAFLNRPIPTILFLRGIYIALKKCPGVETPIKKGFK